MFLETIKIVNGELVNFDLHLTRMAKTLNYHYRSFHNTVLLNHINIAAQQVVKSKCKGANIYKMRIVYTYNDYSISAEPYIAKPVQSLKIVHDNTIDYSYKYEERSRLTSLLMLRENCDDILICKNGFITDTSFSNIVFKKDGSYFTPSHFLLNGTKRMQLVSNGFIKETEITLLNIYEYECFNLINAMLDLNIYNEHNINNIEL